MIPYIIFAWGNVEIAHENRFLRRVCAEMVAHIGQIVEFLTKFDVLFPIRNVAARWHIEIVHRNAVFQFPGDVAGMAEGCEIFGPGFFHRDFRHNGDAIVPFVAARDHVRVSKRSKPIARNFVDRAFAFLQAQHVGGLFFQTWNFSTIGSRRRTELMFHVARVKGIFSFLEGGANLNIVTAFAHGARLTLGISQSAKGGGEILALRELVEMREL